jgi:epsin
VSAKELTALILDEERLRTERQDRKAWKSRVTGIEEFGPPAGFGDSSEPSQPRRRSDRRDRRAEAEDIEYRLAIEASKHEAEEDRKRRERNASVPNDDDLAKAIKLSKEEEELRKRELEESNASALFDNEPTPSTRPQATGYNHGYQQQVAVDWNGNTIDPQQPNSTGFLNNAYSNPTGFASQPTGYQGGVGAFSPNGYASPTAVFEQQPQFQQQQQQQQPPQASLLQSQTTAFAQANNPYGQAAFDFSTQSMPQQAMPQQAITQQQTSLSPGSNNPWASAHQQSQLEPLKPLPTGSNNPFASSFGRPQAAAATSPPMSSMQGTGAATAAGTPSLNTLVEQKVQSQFNNHSFNPAVSFAPAHTSPQKELSAQHARLNALLATGEGMDTFGNTGELRVPAQHTAPGTFINSAGTGMGRLAQSHTGTATSNTATNPFMQPQQFGGGAVATGTGTGFAGNAMGGGDGLGYGGPASGRLMPAQTGPAHVNGLAGSPFSTAAASSSNNPFGQSRTQQPQTGSLIDL